MSKSNSFVKFLKNINNLINSLLEQNLNKLNFNNLIKIGRSNKIFLTIVAVVILFLSYLSIPHLFKSEDILSELKNKLNEKFKLEFNFPNKLEYKFFPKPHFTNSESVILIHKNKISEVKKIKIFISIENLFSLKNIKIKEVILDDANFNLNKDNYNFFINLLDNNFTETNLKIKNSNIFFRSKDNEVLFINKIIKMNYFYDPKEFRNILNSKNEIFNIPYSINFYDNQIKKKLYSKFKIDFLGLKVENQYIYNSKIKSGSANFIFNKTKSLLDYSLNKNFFEFKFFNKLDSPKFTYYGKLNFKPFHSYLKGDTDELNLSHILNSNSVVVQFLKTEIFNNKNLNLNIKLKANKIQNFGSFVNILLNSKIHEGLIDVDETSFDWKNYAKFDLFNSLIYVKSGELVLDGKAKININNYDAIYQFLLTRKKFRKTIKKIDLNFTYNFDQKIITVSDIRIDNQYNDNVNKILNNISIKNDDLQNKIYFKNLLNKAIKSYSG